jgi:hypothetical protein
VNLAQPIIVDNVLPEPMIVELEHLLLEPVFDWHYQPILDIVDPHAITEGLITDTKSVGFGHTFVKDGQSRSRMGSVSDHIPFLAWDKLGWDFRTVRVINSRAFLQLPSGSEDRPGHVHRDLPYPHTVCLFYVNDNTAETVFYNDDLEPVTRVKPQRNRAVIFDGSTFHASGIPSASNRIVINFNLMIDTTNKDFVI